MRVLIKGKDCEVDSCIVDLVLDLQIVGTTSSCCGHGQGPGYIALADGRRLLVMPATIPWRTVGWRDLWLQVKASAYGLLQRLGFIEEYQHCYDFAWPRRLVDVRK